MSPYGIDEETGEHGVPLSGMRFALVRVLSAIYLLKVAWRKVVATKDANKRKASAYQPPTKSRIREVNRTGGRRGFSRVEAARLCKGYSKTSGCTGIWCAPRPTRSLVIG
jgi:hypothetical protein